MVCELFKHSSSDINLNLLLLTANLVSSSFTRHSLFLAGPEPIFHSSSFSSPETDMVSKLASSSSTSLFFLFSASLAKAASA